MISIWLVLWLLFSHWIADFVFQNDWMAVNKSKDVVALLAHVSAYAFTVGMLLNIYTSASLYAGWMFILITFLAHFTTDAVTSNITSCLWEKEKRHWFFVTIGFDQLLHYFQLLVTYKLLAGK